MKRYLVDVEVLFDLQVGALPRGDEVGVRELRAEGPQQPQHEDYLTVPSKTKYSCSQNRISYQ